MLQLVVHLVGCACPASPGNPLQETRLRALRNVLFKTNHGLVPTECLVHERAFLVALLEWFNFPDVSHEAQVLGLLGRLAKVRAISTGVHTHSKTLCACFSCNLLL